MALKVAINGFGRIGRLAFRHILDSGAESLEVVAVNDLTDADTLGYLLKYDSAQGRFDADVKVEEDAFVVNGKEVKVFAERDPENLPWKDLGIDLVLECTGFFNSKDGGEKHITAGAKRVILSAPGGADVPMIVYNTNHDTLTGEETVISGASCTTNCLAPMANALHKNFGLEAGQMTTIHAYTSDQAILDAPHAGGNYRRGRAAAENIVPNTTGAAAAIGFVLPELDGKLDGAAQRVPVVTGSLTELFSVLEKEVTVEEVNAAMKEASNESFGYNEDQIVSSDIVGYPVGSLFDATQTKIVKAGDKQLVKTVSWYDNEMGYVSQLVRTAVHFGNL